MLYEKELYEANTGTSWYGTTNAKSATYCYKLLGTKDVYYSSSRSVTGFDDVPDSAMLVAKMAYKTFFNWVSETYPQAFQ